MGTFFLRPPAILLEKAHEWHSASTTTWPDTGLSPSLELEPHQTTNPIQSWERASRNHSVLAHNGNQARQWLLIPLCVPQEDSHRPLSGFFIPPHSCTQGYSYTHLAHQTRSALSSKTSIWTRSISASATTSGYPKTLFNQHWRAFLPPLHLTTRHAQGYYSTNDIDIPDPLWDIQQSIHWANQLDTGPTVKLAQEVLTSGNVASQQ